MIKREKNMVKVIWIKGVPFCAECGRRLEKKNRWKNNVRCPKCNQPVKWN